MHWGYGFSRYINYIERSSDLEALGALGGSVLEVEGFLGALAATSYISAASAGGAAVRSRRFFISQAASGVTCSK